MGACRTAAEEEPQGPWIGLGAGAVAVGMVVSSLILIAPGTAVGGVSVGWLTPGAAADAISQRLAETTIVLTGDGADAEVTGADLGASVEARSLADAAFAEHPLWNPGSWFAAPADVAVQVDAIAATSALRSAAPDLYVDPVDATLAFDPAAGAYVVTPAQEGTGIDVATVGEALEQAFAAGQTRVEVEATAAAIPAAIPTDVAESTAGTLNGMLSAAGFYVGAERVAPMDAATVASWLTITPTDQGTFDISADAAAIQNAMGGLAEAVDRDPVNATVITNSSGEVLREEVSGVTGRVLGDTSNVANDYAEQLAAGNAVYELPVTETAFATTALARRIEVNLGTQRAVLFENDRVVKELTISSGLAGTPTPAGRFTVNGYSQVQSMGCFEGAPYCVRDVPWVTWFAPDIGFHGANSLRSQLGFPQSHGCVNMWDGDAKFVYDWTARGTEVWVH